MLKNCFILFVALLFAVLPSSNTQAESLSNNENGYVTTEDIISDIIFPSVDKKVVEEYGDEDAFGWELHRITGIKYNHHHSYDVTVRIKIDMKDNPHKFTEDSVTIRIYPPCDSEKIECNHDFKLEILEYQPIS